MRLRVWQQASICRGGAAQGAIVALGAAWEATSHNEGDPRRPARQRLRGFRERAAAVVGERFELLSGAPHVVPTLGNSPLTETSDCPGVMASGERCCGAGNGARRSPWMLGPRSLRRTMTLRILCLWSEMAVTWRAEVRPGSRLGSRDRSDDELLEGCHNSTARVAAVSGGISPWLPDSPHDATELVGHGLPDVRVWVQRG